MKPGVAMRADAAWFVIAIAIIAVVRIIAQPSVTYTAITTQIRVRERFSGPARIRTWDQRIMSPSL